MHEVATDFVKKNNHASQGRWYPIIVFGKASFMTYKMFYVDIIFKTFERHLREIHSQQKDDIERYQATLHRLNFLKDSYTGSYLTNESIIIL